MSLILSWLCIIFCLHTAITETCDGEIILKPSFNDIVYSNWVNTTTKLICPISEYDWSIWYSDREVYKQTIGCVSEVSNTLILDVFPDVPFIVAIFKSKEKGMSMQCIFSSSNGLLSARMLPLLIDINDLNQYENSISTSENQTLDINFIICNSGEVRNGTCLIYRNNGTTTNDRTNVQMDAAYYRVTGSIRAHNLEKYVCVVNLNRTLYEFAVIPKPDPNECQLAKDLGYNLCSVSECVDITPGYKCVASDYTNAELCKTEKDWFCPHTATFDYMQKEACPSDACIDAANMGIALCDGEIRDCIPENQSYVCANGLPLLDVCKSYGAELNISCPVLASNNTELARRFGRSLKALAYNAQTLYQSAPKNLIRATEQMTDDMLLEQLQNFDEDSRVQLAKQLLESIAITLQDHIDTRRRTTNWTEGTIDLDHSPSPAASELTAQNDKIRSITGLIHVVAAISRQTPAVRSMIDQGRADRNGVKFMRLGPGANSSVKVNVSMDMTVELMVQTNQTLTEDLVAMVPEKYLNTGQDSLAGSEFEDSGKDRAIIDSDVVVIDSATANSKYQLTMNLLEQPTNNLQCQQLHHSDSASEDDWSSRDCVTVVVGLRYECHCTSSRSGTFAIALVYWIGTHEIPTQISPLINLLNYVFIAIAITALFLFLIFSLFVGVFRLDQFNIAFCLLLSVIVPLVVPHVSEKEVVICTLVAIAICFFPLAAFSWKFIFGLNTLLLIVSPRSRYHEWVSKRSHYVPLLWIGYLVPALIVGVWFGYADGVSHSGRCIGPAEFRWAFIGPITAVVLFNLIVLLTVSSILLRSYLLTRNSRITKTTHLFVLTQLMLTLGIPYIVILLQFLDFNIMLIALPIVIALTSLMMFLLVAVIDRENRERLSMFFRVHFLRTFGQTTKSQARLNGQSPKAGKIYRFVSWSNAKMSRRTEPTSARKRSTAEECLQVDIKDGYTPMLQDAQTITSSDPNIKFEPGWHHRIPAYNYKPGNADWNNNSKRTSSEDEFSGIIMREAPIARMDTMRSTFNQNSRPLEKQEDRL